MPSAAASPADPALEFLRHSVRLRAASFASSWPPWFVGLAATLWPVVNELPVDRYLPWLAGIVALSVVRIVHLHLALRAIDGATPGWLRRTDRRLSAGFIVQAAVAGALVWVVGPRAPVSLQVFATLVLALAAVGAFVAMASDPRAYSLGLAVELGQPILYWVTLGHAATDEGLALAAVLLLFGAVVMRAAYRNGELLRESFFTRFEKDELLGRLQVERDEAERARERADASRREAERASLAKSQFLAAASHDLRQPLYALSLYSGTLAGQVTGARALRTVASIRQSVEALDRLFEGLLDLSAFDARTAQPVIDEFDLRTLVDQLETEFRIQAGAKGLELAVRTEWLRVRSDRVLLERVLRNLLTNAVAYTERGGICLTLQRAGDAARIDVEDTGPGIAEEDRARVFDEFVQLENPARHRAKGTGLGLAVVNRINRLLDLGLSLESAPGRGSRFTLQVPLAPARADASVRGAAPAPTPDPARPLDTLDLVVGVVEDDPLVSDALRAQLEAWGCEALLFESRRALDEARAVGPFDADVWLIDDMLDDEATGLDIARELAARLPRERLMIMTGNSLPGRREAIAAAGFRLLVKPVLQEQLHRALAAARV